MKKIFYLMKFNDQLLKLLKNYIGLLPISLQSIRKSVSVNIFQELKANFSLPKKKNAKFEFFIFCEK
jgi:hypothetical protein